MSRLEIEQLLDRTHQQKIHPPRHISLMRCCRNLTQIWLKISARNNGRRAIVKFYEFMRSLFGNNVNTGSGAYRLSISQFFPLIFLSFSSEHFSSDCFTVSPFWIDKMYQIFFGDYNL